jgi:hypothetical protein
VNAELRQLAALLVRVAPTAGLRADEAEAMGAFIAADGVHADAARRLELAPSTYRSRFDAGARKIRAAVQAETGREVA